MGRRINNLILHTDAVPNLTVFLASSQKRRLSQFYSHLRNVPGYLAKIKRLSLPWIKTKPFLIHWVFQSGIHSFNKYLLSILHMPGTLLQAVYSLSLMLNTLAKKVMSPSLYRGQDQWSYWLSNLPKVAQLVRGRVGIKTQLQNQTPSTTLLTPLPTPLTHTLPVSPISPPPPHDQGGCLLYRVSSVKEIDR